MNWYINFVEKYLGVKYDLTFWDFFKFSCIPMSILIVLMVFILVV